MNSQELQLVNYEQVKRLKKAGFNFDNLCFHYYDDNGIINDYDGTFGAPSVALALKWIRDEKGIVNAVMREQKDFGKIEYCGQFKDMHLTDFSYDTYESAESALLDELLNILEENN